ncbi:unnamed protein product, partial [Sphacelaria rigidula]
VGFPPALGLYEREGFYPCALVGFRVEKKRVRMCASSRCELESRPAPIFRRSICGLPRKKEGRERVRRIFLAVCEKKYANVLSAGTHEDKIGAVSSFGAFRDTLDLFTCLSLLITLQNPSNAGNTPMNRLKRSYYNLS